MDRQPISSPDWRSPAKVPATTWLLAGAAVLAVAVGTVVRGFVGADWFFTSDNLARAIPSALPFVVAASILAGAFRWPSQRSWLVAAAVLLATHGILEIAVEGWFVWWTNSPAPATSPNLEGALFARGVISYLAFAGGFAAIAIALFRAVERGSGVPRAVLVTVAAVGAVASSGTLAVASIAWGMSESGRAPETIWWLVTALQLGAATLLAVAALRALPHRHRLPELLVAGGAMLFVLATGPMHWLVALIPMEAIELDVIVALSRLEIAALVVLALGFASARLFPPREA